MPNAAISGLTASATNLAAADVLPVVQTTGVGPVKMTGQQIAGGLLGSTTLSGTTITASAPVANLTQTWNNAAVTFTGFRLNVTDTTSATASLLIDLQVGGASRFRVDKVGNGTFGNNLQVTNATRSDGGYNIFGDTFLSRRAAANWRFGAADAAAPVAQTLSVQSGVTGASATTVSISGTALTIAGTVTGTIAIGHAVTGTGVSAGTLITAGSGTSWTVNNSQTVGPITAYFNSVGRDFTITGNQASGPSAGGSIVFQVAPAGAAATTAQNALVSLLTLDASNRAVTINATGGSYSLIPIAGQNALYMGENPGGNYRQLFTPNGVIIGSEQYLAWHSALPNIAQTPDTILRRDAANTLALRNGVNAQTFNVYNTFTDASNYERLAVNYTSNIARIETTQAGTGSSRIMLIRGDQLFLRAGSSGNGVGWQVDNSGNFMSSTDNSYDIGAVSATRPRNVYIAGTINVGSTANFSGSVVVGGSVNLTSGGSTFVRAAAGSADGCWLLRNNASAGFDRIQLGGTTSSFPALKRSSASLIVRLADDSANAPLESASVKTDAPAGGTAAVWKLGAVATVTPTLQNRTIEVDIGGTIYYISAKTTND